MEAYDESGKLLDNCDFSIGKIVHKQVEVNGEQKVLPVFVKLTQEEYLQTINTLESRVSRLESVISKIVSFGVNGLSFEDKSSFVEQWVGGITYEVGDIVKYCSVFFMCKQKNVSVDTAAPDKLPDAWEQLNVGSDGVVKWVQPTGAHDSYANGAVVYHAGKRWVSVVDNNVWEPGLCCWREDANEQQGEVAEWVQPTGAHDVYSKGDVVMYNGKKYMSKIDANAWAPDVYGWDQV